MTQTEVLVAGDIADYRPNYQDRILAIREGELQPLLAPTPTGPPSPSRSLLVERHEVERAGQQRHVHTNDVLTLFLTPATMRYSPDGGRLADLRPNAGQVAICVRDGRESLVWSDPMSILCVQVGDVALRDAARSMLQRDQVSLQGKPLLDDHRLSGLLYALEAERVRQYPSGRLFLDSVEAALAALLVSSHSMIRARPMARNGGLPPRSLHRVLEFMHGNLAEPVTLENLASQAGLSASHFSHQFRASLGMSPYKYMRGLRIDRGKTLLKNRNLSVLEVAVEVGFENQQHFATVFRSVVGVTPSDYRRQF
jgi:AraC family transcriptional regulator